MRSPHPPDEATKLAGLDLIRFFSAFAILIWHYQHFSFVGLSNPGFEMEKQPFFPALSFLYREGHSAVFVFWCISGYVFFWKYRDTIAQKKLTARDFLVLRVSRLYPLHWATLIAAAVCQWGYLKTNGAYFLVPNNDLRHFLLQLPMASHWRGFQGGFSFNGPIWSVSIEILAYILFYVQLRLFGRSTWLTLLIAALSVLDVATQTTGHPLTGCLALFYAGGLAAIFGRTTLAQRGRAAFGVVGAVLLVLIPATAYRTGPHTPSFAFYFVLIYAPILLHMTAKFFAAPAGARPLIEAAGNMTYASYLLHFPSQIAIAWLFSAAHRTIPIYQPWFFTLWIAMILTAAFATYRFFEMPAQNWLRRRLLSSSPRRTPAVVAVPDEAE